MFLKNYIVILAGSIVMAVGITGFLAPNEIATGGTAGLAIVMHHLIPWPIGVLMALINIPLIILGYRYLGKSFVSKTVFCIASIVVSVDVLDNIIQVPNLSNNTLLATLYGGIFIGAGLGFIFKGGASAGGGSILAKIISKLYHQKESLVIMILDGLVIVLTGIVFQNMELALWSLIGIYTTSKMIDMILIGAGGQKIVHISSSKNLVELSNIINEQLQINGTLVNGHDLGNTEHKDIIFLMVDKNKLQSLKLLVLKYDENVKMIVMEATEVLGKGKLSF
jgi:uncharacterized membrane-anchored protein YitT (DUF2179 family)